MLSLSRNIGESIVIGDNRQIKIVVLGIKGCKVQLGCIADRKIPIHREEIANRIDQEKE